MDRQPTAAEPTVSAGPDNGPSARSAGARTRFPRGWLACTLAALTAMSWTAVTAAEADDPGPVEISGARFEATTEWAGHPLQRVGAGLLRYRIVFKGYSAALYLPPGIAGTAWQEDVPKCLELYYYWDIDADLFGPAGREVLARTHDETTLAPLESRLDAIDAAYVDIADGDRYALCYAPDEGTTLLHNQVPLATVEGADFARTYYKIWLGPEPVDAGLRDALTGGGR